MLRFSDKVVMLPYCKLYKLLLLPGLIIVHTSSDASVALHSFYPYRFFLKKNSRLLTTFIHAYMHTSRTVCVWCGVVWCGGAVVQKKLLLRSRCQ